MSKVDQLIAVFKEVKEELSKNMNGAMNPGDHKPNPTTGTSGGQGGMYRSEDLDKNVNCAAGAQDMNMIKASKNGQWSMSSVPAIGKKSMGKLMAEKNKLKPHEAKHISSMSEHDGSHDAEDHPAKLSVAGARKLTKSEEAADQIIEKLEKACGMKKEDSYVSQDGKNREANPKLRASDLGPGGKVHMVKEEGTNECANPTQPHNKEKFKVMPMEPKTSVKHLEATGAPYNGKDKDVKKEDMEKDAADPKLAPKDKKVKALQQQVDAGTYKPDSKKIANAMLKGEPVQGNEAKGFDENKAPGRGTYSV